MKITIIGAGPGGYEAAIYAAKQGHEVTLVEKSQFGGTCLNRGCIPTKALLAVTNTLESIRAASGYGVEVSGEILPSFAKAYERKDQIVSNLRSGVAYLLNSNKVNVVKGYGRLDGVGRVAVTKADGTVETIEANHIILATGSTAMVPALFPYDGERVITSDEVLSLNKAPASLLIIGGGVIGCEVGQFMRRMGVDVTIVEMLDCLLPMEDKDISRQIEKKFKKEGIKIVCGVGVTAMSTENDHVRVSLQNGDELSAEKVLVSIGRKSATADIGLEMVGIKPDAKGFIHVDEFMRTAIPGIYAIGDIVPSPQLAHVAAQEGFTAVDHISGKDKKISYRAIPRCVYTSPEVAAVGITETEASKRGMTLGKGSYDFRTLGKAQASGKTEGFVKVLVDENDVIVGGAIVGADATDMLHTLTIAVEMGITAEKLGQTVFPHPTMCEAVLEALHDVHKMSVHK